MEVKTMECIYTIDIPHGLSPFLESSSIPMFEEVTPANRKRKEKYMSQFNDSTISRVNTTLSTLEAAFNVISPKSKRANKYYCALYEMFEIAHLGQTIPPHIQNPEEYKKRLNAAYYDHGNKSSTSLLLSGMSKYAEVDFEKIQHILTSISSKKLSDKDRNGMLAKLTNDVGNMEFILAMVSIGEYITAIYDKAMDKIFAESTLDYTKQRMMLLNERNEALDKISTLTNNYLKQVKLGRQKMYPNISPAAKNSFTALATKLCVAHTNFGGLSNKNEIMDINYARSLIAPLLACTDLNASNPFMSNMSYTGQIQAAEATYYNKEQKMGRNTLRDNMFDELCQ